MDCKWFIFLQIFTLWEASVALISATRITQEQLFLEYTLN
jgi:hypothetical protein